MPDTNGQPTCFMAMPISTQTDHTERYGGDHEHWKHVMHSLFEKAIEAAGFRPIRPVTQGSHLIHGEIIKNLTIADLVLVDLSSHNPNVFFELGVRTSLNLPITLVRDEHTSIPFDTAGINTYAYDSNLRGWEIERQQAELAEHIKASHSSCRGENPLWRQFGLTIKATEPDTNESPLEAKMDLLADRVLTLQQSVEERERHAAEDRSVRRWRTSDLARELGRRQPPEDLYRLFDSDAETASANRKEFVTRARILSDQFGIPILINNDSSYRFQVKIPTGSRRARELQEEIRSLAEEHAVDAVVIISSLDPSFDELEK